MIKFFFGEKNPLAQVKTYQIYYGPIEADERVALQKSDLVIVEPRHCTRETVRTLKQAKTLVYGYVSVMETPVWNEDRFRCLQPEDYLLIDGQRRFFPEWDSYLMNLQNPSYQKLLLEEIHQQVIQKGMDGIFLDTVGDIDEYVPEENRRRALQNAYRSFLQKTLELDPRLSIIQNRGFDTLPWAREYIDGLLWEDWRGDLLHDEWVVQRLKLLEKYKRRRLKVLTVSASVHPVHKQAATRLGFVHLSAPLGYAALATD